MQISKPQLNCHVTPNRLHGCTQYTYFAPDNRSMVQTKVQGIRFSKDGYSFFKGTQISREYSFGKLDAKFEGMENHVSPKSNSTLQYEQGYHKSNHEPSMSDSSQDPWDGISSIGLFASANVQTFESFPEDESSKKKKKKRRRGFSL